MFKSKSALWDSFLKLRSQSDFYSAPDKDYTTHRVLIGTHTEGGAPNYLQIATVTLPKRKPPKAEDYDEDSGEIGGYGRSKGKTPLSNIKFSIVQKIDHPGEVNKVR